MSVIVEQLNDIVPDQKARFNPIFTHIRGGMVVWDANLSCQFVSPSLDYLIRANGNASLAESPTAFFGLDTPRKGRYQRHFHTPQGPRYIDATLQPVMDKAQRLVGYMAICQDVTEIQEPLQFQSQFIELLKAVAVGENPEKTAPSIYKCINTMGFQDMRVILNKGGQLETYSQIVSGKHETGTAWDQSLKTNPLHPLVVMTAAHQAGQPLQVGIWPWEGSDLTILPMADQGELLGYLVLSNHYTSPIPTDVLEPNGKLVSFTRELSPVFRRIFFYNPNGNVDPGLLMRSKLEAFNLNQKQIRILEMVLKGESNKGIAEVVHLSEQGVKYHVGNLLEKFECKNRIELRAKLHQLLNGH